MYDELDALRRGHTDLEDPSRLSRAYEHDQIVELEYSDGVSIGVKHVFVGDPAPTELVDQTVDVSGRRPERNDAGPPQRWEGCRFSLIFAAFPVRSRR
jgi:hypothetical protein